MKLTHLSLIYALTTSTLLFSDTYTVDEAKNIQASLEEDVSVNEDLMREHGILNRLLLVYEEIAKRIEQKQNFPMETLSRSSKLIREFLEDHHEKIEEEYIFPYFEQQDEELADLVHTLKEQHEVGRKLTDYIISHANEETLRDEKQAHLLSRCLRLYIDMFRPHEAREDTVLFPAFHKLVSPEEYKRLGDMFEEMEHEHFGEDGFDVAVNEVTSIEKELGIYNLSQFTPEFTEEN